MKKFEILQQEYLNILSELMSHFLMKNTQIVKKLRVYLACFWQVSLIIIGMQKIKL
jgi:hypothetical protein